MPALQENEPLRRDKYDVCSYSTCDNPDKIYEKSHVLQSILRQMLTNHKLDSILLALLLATP